MNVFRSLWAIYHAGEMGAEGVAEGLCSEGGGREDLLSIPRRMRFALRMKVGSGRVEAAMDRPSRLWSCQCV